MLDKLYSNIGSKIKGLAQASFVFESIGAAITGISLIAYDTDNFALGFLLIVFGPIVAFIASWLLYAIGEIVDYLELIEDNTSDLKKGRSSQSPEKRAKKMIVKTSKPTKDANSNDFMASANDDWNKFTNEVIKMSKEDLLLILEDQQDLYTDDEMDYIKEIYCRKLLK